MRRLCRDLGSERGHEHQFPIGGDRMAPRGLVLDQQSACVYGSPLAVGELLDHSKNEGSGFILSIGSNCEDTWRAGEMLGDPFNFLPPTRRDQFGRDERISRMAPRRPPIVKRSRAGGSLADTFRNPVVYRRCELQPGKQPIGIDHSHCRPRTALPLAGLPGALASATAPSDQGDEDEGACRRILPARIG
ncbi:MAG: hypothetical protein WEE66_11165 [Actinomycetota bacterium]